jgi:hypothetical protein
MKLVVSGLSSRDEVALGMFLKQVLKRWELVTAPARRGALPPADVYLIDLVAWGLGQWSEKAQCDLLALLGGTPAVLLSSANERSWESMDGELARQHGLTWIFKPYRSADMQAALVAAAALRTKVESAPAAPPVRAGAEAVRPAVSAQTVTQEPSAPEVPEVIAPPALTPVHEADLPGMTIQELHAQLEGVTDGEPHVFLRKLSGMLQNAQPLEVRFTIQHLLVIHPEHGWVASNTPMQVIEMVCRSKGIASSVSMRHIGADEAEDWAQRLHMPLVELEPFLLQLATATFGKAQQP